MKHNSKKPLLTISLLISDRLDTIRRCLDSLRPIMKEIPSELILVDTSKNPEVHNILLEYTDQVYEFEWCNDFAKARNVGLKKAKGEWFMFLDDDEWFVEIEELVKFFRSGEYKSYSCVDHRIRNFLDVNFERYSECWVTRLYKIEPDSAFHSKVHEYYAPLRGRKKQLYALSYHSGYAFATEEDRRARYERNTRLLYEMIEAEPENMRWKMQLAQEFGAMSEWDKLEDFCKETIDLINSSKWECNAELCCFFAGYVHAIGAQKKHEDAIEAAKDVMKDPRSLELIEWQMYYRLAENYFNCGDWSEAKKYGNLFLEMASDPRKRDEVIQYQNKVLLLGETFDESRISKTYPILIVCDLKEKDTGLLHKWYDKLEWSKARLIVANDVEEHLIEAVATLEHEPIFLKLLEDAYSNRELRLYMSRAIERWSEKNEEQYKKLIQLLSKVDSDDKYVSRAKLLSADWNNDEGEVNQRIQELFVNTADVFVFSEMVLDITQRRKIDLYSHWVLVDADNWKLAVRKVFTHPERETVDKYTKEIRRIFQEGEWKRAFYEMYLARYEMQECGSDENVQAYIDITFHFYEAYYRLEEEVVGDYEELSKNKSCARTKLLAEAEDSYEELTNKFNDYMIAVLEYYLTIYKDEAFSGEMEMLPPEARAAAWLNDFFGRDDSDWEGKIVALKEAGKACISLGDKVKEYAIMIGEKRRQYEEEKSKTARDANAQLQQMVAVMKEKIRQMVEQGMRQEALAVVRQVRALAPTDQELEQMERELQ